MAVMKHQDADLRRHVRTSSPLGLRINGTTYTVKEWSLGGFSLDDFPTNGLTAGDRLSVRLSAPCQGLEVSFFTDIEIVRVAPEGGSLAARFLALNPREKEALAFALLGTAKNGERASLLEALSRIGSPVTSTPVVPSAREAPTPSNRARLWRRAVYSIVYWLAGLVLSAMILLMLYWYFFRLDLEYSVVSLPLYPIVSQDVARCQEIYVKEGDKVRAGQSLMKVVDDSLSKDLETAQLLFATAAMDVRTAEARVKAETDLLNLYPEIAQAKLDMAKGQVAGLTAQVEAARAMLKRHQSLAATKTTSSDTVNEKELALAGYERELAVQQGEMRIAEQALSSLKRGSYYNSRELVGALPQYLVGLQDAQEKLRIAADRVKLAEAHARRLTYVAPFDGKVVKLLKAVDGTMNRGETVVVLEKAAEQPVVDCFVTQEDANSLSVGAQAAVWVAALDKTYQGTIVKIDRTSGFLTEMQSTLKDAQARYNWRGQDDKSAYVQLAFAGHLTADDEQALAGGMPAIVSLPRTPTLWRSLKSLLE
jgi:multidrug resistance efflux pump